MDAQQNVQPLLEANSDSEEVLDENVGQVRRRTTDSASGSHLENSSHSDNNDSDTHDIRDLESNTDDFDDDIQNLFKASNTVPNDRFSLIYMIFYLLGTTTLLPWNVMIAAEDVSISEIRKFSRNFIFHISSYHLKALSGVNGRVIHLFLRPNVT